MKVRIKRTGTYSRFGLPHGKVGAQELADGDVVELPDSYVVDLIDKGYMEEYIKPKSRGRPRQKTTSPQPDMKRHIPKVTADEAFGVGKRK